QDRLQALLSAHPRLPGSLAARLADPKAAGDPSWTRRAAFGRPRRALVGQARESAPALGAGVGQHPTADEEERVVPAARADDAAGRARARTEGTDSGDPDRSGELGRD